MELRNWDGLPHGRDDVSRKFHNCFVKVIAREVGPHPIVAQVGDFDSEYVRLHYHEPSAFSGGTTTKSREAAVEWGSLEVVESYPPVIGAIPFFDKVLFLKRLPARQWQVGLCNANTELRDHNLVSLRLTLTFAEALFNPVYETIPVRDVVRRFETNPKLEAYAINSVYWLRRDKDRVILYRNQLPLGTFLFGKLFLNAPCVDFKQELWDDLLLKADE